MKKALLLALCLLFLADNGYAHKRTYTTKEHHHKHAKGLKRHPERHKKFKEATKHVSYLHEDAPVPGKADISPKVSPPENQGSCGSCWDFSLTKALRSSWMVAGKDPGQLEFNYLLNNCGPGTKEDGCNGGDFPAADNFLNSAGPGLNKDNPYTQQDGGQCKGLPVAATALSYQMLGTSGSGPTFKDLAYAVGVLSQALSIDVAAGAGEWENYNGGIYNGCTGDAGSIDHMINLVGYDCETSLNPDGSCKFDANGEPVNGDGYLIVMNNWGDWGTTAASGLSGYMNTRFKVNGQNCNAVATDALMFTVAQVPPPTPPPTPPPVPPTPDSGGIPWWVFAIIGGIVVVLVVVVVAKKGSKVS